MLPPNCKTTVHFNLNILPLLGKALHVKFRGCLYGIYFKTKMILSDKILYKNA